LRRVIPIFHQLLFSESYTGTLGRVVVEVRLILLGAIIASVSFSQSLPNNLDFNEVHEAPPDNSSWLYHNSTSAKIYEVHDGEIILNGGEYSKINYTGYHLIESAPGGSGSSGACGVATFHLNGSWFKLQDRFMYKHNGTGWEFTSTNLQEHVDYLNCYQQFIRIDYENQEFTVASYAAKKGNNYDQNNCRLSSYFSTFDSNGSHLSTREYFLAYGNMQTASNGRCRAEVLSHEQGFSNKHVILKSNNSILHGTEQSGSNGADYVLMYVSNNTEAYTLANYQNMGYREGVNYFANSSGENILFRGTSNSLIVTVHSNGTISNRTIPDPFPTNDDCIQTKSSNGLFGIPSYIQCENGDIVDIENQSTHNYGNYTPTIIDEMGELPEIGLWAGWIFTVDSDDDGVEYFSDQCPHTVVDEEVDQYGCSDDQYVDRWIKIELKSWEADQSKYWDSNQGLPDPYFHVIVGVDGDEFGTYTSPTWENTWTLGNVWNLSIDIPNGARIIDIEIQCKDNDALNDDECEMNSEDGEWKLYFQFDVYGPSTVDFSGDGTTDNDTSWREAASNWTISYLTYDEIDSDEDGVINRFDECQGFDDNIDLDSDEIPDGCDDFIDSDGDGVIDDEDQCPGHDDAVDADSDDIADGCDSFVDSDGDGTADEDDLCPNTPLGAIVDWGCPMDDDEDGVYDGLDDCPNSVGYSGVDANGCDLDSDSDGMPDWDDLCPNTPLGEEINLDDFDYWGCSSSQIDRDDDGVNDNLDQCPNSVGYSGVDANGCDLDSDSDGIFDFDDQCPNTPQNAVADYMGCPSDSDSDGVFDGIDECPSSNNPTPADMDKSSEVDSTGCYIVLAKAGSDSANNPAVIFFGVVGTIVFVVLWTSVVRKIRNPKQEQVSDTQTQLIPSAPILPIQKIQMPDVVIELEKQRSQAQIESQQLRQQLSSQSISASQMAAMKQELDNLQQRVSDSEYVKSQLVQEIDDMKKKSDSELSMKDSVIAGDALVGSTKIGSQTINNDPEAIARAAIEAYRMAKEEQLN
jgi:hypothetical protein